MAPSQTFHDHLKEFRRRLMWVMLAIGISGGISFALYKPLVVILQKPLGAPLFYTSPAGSFNFILKLSVIIGMFVALPVMIYHLIRFIEPALPIRIKRKQMIKVIGASFTLAVAGVCFGFFLMIPLSLHFFMGYSSAEIKPLITANEYLTFVLNHMLTFAVVFQIPLIILFINWIKPIKPSQLLKWQRHIIVAAFGISVLLPFTYDPVSQFIVAVPIVGLYYLSVLLLVIVNRKHKDKIPAKFAPAPAPMTPPLARRPVSAPLPVPMPRPTFSPHPRALDGFTVSTRRKEHTQTRRPAVESRRSDRPVDNRPTLHLRPFNRKMAIDGVSRLATSF